MEMELNFAIDNASDTFRQASWLVLALSLFDDSIDLCSRSDGKGRLIDCLVAGIELRYDEMTGGPEGQHPGGKRVVIGLKPWKAW